jgi:hypothetical protein
VRIEEDRGGLWDFGVVQRGGGRRRRRRGRGCRRRRREDVNGGGEERVATTAADSSTPGWGGGFFFENGYICGVGAKARVGERPAERRTRTGGRRMSNDASTFCLTSILFRSRD